MKTYYFKIREKYIDSIINGTKKREYRLANPERREIKVGDSLVLISNQNKRNYIKVSIKSIKLYQTWYDALKEHWDEDFKGLYSSLEDALKECYRFYAKEDVEKYGIIVYGIEPIKSKLENISVLLDTNILIKRESNNNTSFEITKLFNWFNKQGVNTFVHSSSKKEIEKYQNIESMNSIITKLNSYDELPSINCAQDKKFEEVVSKYSLNENSKIDNELLKEVYNNNVDMLLTDDNLMLKKAEELYIRDRVLSSQELLKYYNESYPQNIEYKMLSVKLMELSNVDLNSEFFDSLREDYGGIDFDNWFKKKARNKEKAYVFMDQKELKGFLYLKVEDEKENYNDISPTLLPKKRLKVGTFKIERTGFKLNERFLKIIFDTARFHKVDEIYVTLFEDKREGVKVLESIMEQWGFEKWGYKENGEAVLVKTMKEYKINETPKFNYPLIKANVNYFFLPIFPQYHTDLFPDLILKNEDMHLYKENKAHRYALEKIYLSGAMNIHAKPGDLVFIYRTGDRYPKRYSSVVTGLAIIEDIIYTSSVEDCINKCGTRTIFSEQEIREIYKKYPVIIKLLDYKPLKNKVILDKLYEYNVVENKSGPRPFQPINKEDAYVILNEGMSDEQ